ncbi:hypothetical protein JM83_1283 [Gillisia sp. Hel_I_86]|uniref:hypothetical protein n=1 Tax=Gillisia sp. Hel_I_86 TaxID=1249981 RepID=UPI00119A2343|nr:hypothetical protein [Gillisia sp. Hel_I_86]TVZ26327.1 hypothetical protein JM83_1283 [Gillisia sp. Hel_I_86]
MMRKTFIYMVLAIRAVFLFGVNLCEAFWKIVSKPSKFLLRTFVVALIILSSFNSEVLAQGNNCPPGQRYCRGDCRPARDCRGPISPPPGLPIDSKLPYLLIAGLGLGIYYLKSKKTT